MTNIIQNHLIRDPDLDVAEQKLLATDGLKRFYNSLKTPKEKADFRQHLRRYMQIYLPDCPFEVSSTNRYTVTTHEASIVARRFIKRNESIKYLSGIQVVITAEEEEALSSRKKDFSIVVSSRNRMTSLFMGPARFANHDCGANAKLVITGQAGIDIVAVRSIAVGEEITVTYGENYFGEGNCECLCQTCEQNLVHGWKQPDGVIPVKKSIEGDLLSQGYNTRGRRRYDRGDSSSRTPSITPDIRPKVYKTKAQRLRGCDRISTTDSSLFEGLAGASKRRRDTESLATPPITPAKKQKTTHYEIQPIPNPIAERSHSSDAESAGTLSRSESSNGEAMLTDVTTPEDTTDPADVPSNHTPVPQAIENLKQEQDVEQLPSGGLQDVAPFLAPTDEIAAAAPLLQTPVRPRGLAIRDILNTPSEAATPEGRTPTDRFAAEFEMQHAEQQVEADEGEVDDQPVAMEPLASLSIEVAPDLDDSTVHVEISTELEAPLKRGRGRPRKHPKTEVPKSRKTPSPAPQPEPTPVVAKVEPERPASPAVPSPVTYREPGDYELTPRLLSEPNMAWVRCMICSNAFVQQNAYYTRSSCPRCERHSKLYGYVWPKTQREGPWDKEERVLDHRTIHRFLALDQELLVRGRTIRTQSQTGTPKREDSSAGPTKRAYVRRGRLSKKDEVDDGKNDGIKGMPGHDAIDSEVRRSGRMRKASFKVVGNS